MRQIFRPQPHERRFFPPAGPVAPAFAVALPLLSTGLSIAGQIQKANAEAGMANYQAQVARNNRMVAEWNAERASQQGRVDEQQQRFKTGQLIGSQRAALAAQGGDINSGSPLDIVTDTARAGEFDAQTIRNAAAHKAYGFRVQAANLGADAGRYDISSANTMAALPFGIGSSLLGGLKNMENDAGRYVSMLPRGGS
jgi:hypothetical protein